jgi:hypothetical protein
MREEQGGSLAVTISAGVRRRESKRDVLKEQESHK